MMIASPRKAIRLSTFLGRLIWLCVLPLLLLSAYLATERVLSAQEEQDQKAKELADDVVTVIEQRLDARIGALKMLAVSPLADDASRWQDYYQVAQGFYQSFGSHVVFANLDMRMLFNTRVPFGSSLPMLPTPSGRAAVPSAIKTGMPAVGDTFLGPIAKEPLVAIAVPGQRGGKTAFVLLTISETRQFQDLLEKMTLPFGWSLTLFDSKGEVMARRAPSGQSQTAEIDAGAGRFVAHSPLSSWSVLVEIPHDTYRAPLISAATALAIALLVATLSSVLGGMMASRRLGTRVASLAEDPLPGAPPPDIAEIATVRKILDETAKRRENAEEELRQLAEQLEARVKDRTRDLAASNAFLAEREAEMRAIVVNQLDCVIHIDSAGVVRSVNPAVERVLGYAAAEVVGHNVSMLMPDPHRSAHDAYLGNYLRTGVAKIIGIGREVEGHHKDGRLIPLELAVSEFVVHGERQFIGTLRDISERKRFIAELTQARADAEQANRAKSSFLAAMSHEIRTPMNGVVGIVELLGQSHLSEHQTDLVKTIRESASTLLGIIDDILDFSKIEAGRLEIEQEPVSVSDLVEGLCNSLVPVAANRGVNLVLFISSKVPERVLSDDVRLRQMLYNLVGNAIKFSSGRPEHQGRVSIRVEVANDSPLRLAFCVADNGIGMTQETLNNIFTPFTQAEISTTRRFGGTGLGLAICKRLVDLMQGNIAVTSAPSIGSTFTVTLPLELAPEQPVRFLQDLSGVDCIIVASTDLNTDDLREYLQYAGANVVVTADQRDAAKQAAGMATPVILQDVGNANVDFEALRASFAEAPSARHLLITRGRRQRARLGSDEAVFLDGDALRRQALLNAVAVAAGLDSPKVFQDVAENLGIGEEVVTPTIAEARALGRLILVAEDDHINQKVILQQLDMLGYAAEIAGNGREALHLWREGNYVLLLTDLHMPEMDGYALAEAIRGEEAGRRRMPILALTANALRGESSRAKAVGMDEYLTKPVKLRLLKAALEKWLPQSNGKSLPMVLTADAAEEERVAPVVDVTVLGGLVGDDPETIREFLSDYLVAARTAAMEMRAACSADEAQLVSAIAHKLKSSSRSVGTLALGDLCAGLENLGKAGNMAAIGQGMVQFETALMEAETAIEEMLRQK